VALRSGIGRAAKLRAIVDQSPQPSVPQSFADVGAYLGAGQHGGAERTTPAERFSLRERYGAAMVPLTPNQSNNMAKMCDMVTLVP
jgi:hypothetical protein